MHFHHQGHLITLHGTINSLTTPATYHQIQRMMHTKAVAACHSIEMLTHEPAITNHDSLASDSPILKTIPQDRVHILQHYAQAFALPQGLPPNCNHDHHIHLMPNSTPINVKQYRYPRFQKEGMSKIIAEMLDAGLIRPSTSPYSSLVLLVKKKDGTWRFCVDYRALNAITLEIDFQSPQSMNYLMS